MELKGEALQQRGAKGRGDLGGERTTHRQRGVASGTSVGEFPGHQLGQMFVIGASVLGEKQNFVLDNQTHKIAISCRPVPRDSVRGPIRVRFISLYIWRLN